MKKSIFITAHVLLTLVGSIVKSEDTQEKEIKKEVIARLEEKYDASFKVLSFEEAGESGRVNFTMVSEETGIQFIVFYYKGSARMTDTYSAELEKES